MLENIRGLHFYHRLGAEIIRKQDNAMLPKLETLINCQQKVVYF